MNVAVLDKEVPKVCAIILNWNTKLLTYQAIKSLRNNNYLNLTIVIVDNCSTDGSQFFLSKRVRDDEILILNKKNEGYSGGINTAIKHSLGSSFDYFLVMNSDSIASKGTVEALVQTAESDDLIGFVTGKVFYHSKPNTFQIIGKDFSSLNIIGESFGKDEIDRGQYDTVREFYLIDDVFMLIKSSVIERIRGYDPEFFLQYEEADLIMRAKKYGFKCFYTPNAKVWHHVSFSSGGNRSPLRLFYSQRNKLVFTNRHHDSFKIYFFFIYEFLVQIPLTLVSLLIKSDTKNVFAIIRGTLSGLASIVSRPVIP